MKNLFLLAVLIISLAVTTFAQTSQSTFATNDYSDYVNPFIGTWRMGHTFPGAAAPFGMVQLSPETNNPPMYINGNYNPDVYKYCSGYQYDDNSIFGFSHTHFSGTGHSDLGDFLVMPTTGKLTLEPGEVAKPRSGYHSQFKHENEKASPGYYSVLLDDYNILAELTATERVGFHQYTFPKTDSAHIILDLVANIYPYDEKNVWTFVRVENDTTVTGFRTTTGWARTRTLYFVMKFSKPFVSYGHKKYDNTPYKGFYRRFNESVNFPEMAGRRIRAYFDFKTVENEKINVKLALSGVSVQGAMKNLEAEIPQWDFEKVKAESREKWNRELSKVRVKTMAPEDMVTFYTAMYHTMLSPVVFEDADGQYRGLDQEIHTSEGFTNYTIFSLWDTYRALHPLFNILQPKRNIDMINSMLAHYEQSVHHMLPIWSHYANENWCMIGYHAVAVLADAIAKGLTGFDRKKALEAAVSTSSRGYFDGLDYYMSSGYVPEDKSSSSVSKTLEFAYDDWCIAQIAKDAGDSTTYHEYLKRSKNFENHYSKSSVFLRPRLADGSWKLPFDPLDTHGQGYIEGNAWTYSLFVPHDIPRLIDMNGGNKKFIAHLDSLFTMKLEDKYIEKTEDITRDGIIGNYVQGNEPGHHIPYLYNWAGAPWKTQERVRMIMNTMYGNKADGLCGNDDAGQMSAWYIFSALGFYPVVPGTDEYAIGSPAIEEAEILLQNGKTLTINTVNQSKDNVYVQKVLLNGKDLKGFNLSHSDIINGSTLTFYMSASANKKASVR